jgi:hypothetical protein
VLIVFQSSPMNMKNGTIKGERLFECNHLGWYLTNQEESFWNAVYNHLMTFYRLGLSTIKWLYFILNILYMLIYVWRKVVCFVLYLWDPPNQDASDCVLGVFGKLLMRRGAWAWVHDVWTCSAQVFEYWMISSLKIKLNRSWKFGGIGMWLWCCWKDLDEQDVMESIW